MYSYPQYIEHDNQKVIQFMKDHPFVTLIGTHKSGRIAVTQVPVLIAEKDGKIVLRGHIAKKLDHHYAIIENPEVLVLFTSPHIYISGTWYSGNLQQASTWNYISVHARGSVEFLDDEKLIEFLKEFTLYFENGNKESTTIYDNLPSEYLDKIVNAIVAFEIVVTELENVHKISQNRDEKSYDNVIQRLENMNDDGRYIAKKMRENKDQVFKKS
jgi:transcriptional regulator